MNLRGHLKKFRQLYIHAGLAVLVVVALLVIIVQWLSFFTMHNKSMRIPNFEGKPLESLEQFAEKTNLRVYIMDSIYSDHMLPGSIVRHDPLPNSFIKPGRKIYTTIVATSPEIVTMPNLKDLSIRQAMLVLEMNKLTIDKLKFINGFDRNAIQYQIFEGDTIVPGTELSKGSKITLIVSKGLHNPKTAMPFLIGLSPRQAVRAVYNNGFNLGSVQTEKEGAMGVYRVYEQQPTYNKNTVLEPGTEISFRLCPADEMNFDSLILAYTTDSLNTDSLEISEPLDF